MVLPAALTKEPEEREFVVDSRESMHMVSKRDLNSAELETMRTSRSPTTVMTANGQVQTRGEATENVKALDLFITVMLLDETPAVLSLGKLREDHGYTYHWTTGQNLTKKKRQENSLQYFKLCAIRSPWIICEFLYDAHTYFFIINPLHRLTETENKNKNGREEVQSDLLHDLLEFKENLVDECDLSEPQGNPELGYRDTFSSSHELPMEWRAKVEPCLHALSEEISA